MPRRAMPKKNGPRTGQANTRARPKRQPAQRQSPPQQGGGGDMYAGGTQGYNEMDPYQYAGDGYSPMMAQGGQQSYGGYAPPMQPGMGMGGDGVPGVPVSGGGGFWAGGNGSAPGYPTSGGGGVPRAPVGGGGSSSGFVQGGKDLGGGHIAGTGQGGPPRPYDPNQNY